MNKYLIPLKDYERIHKTIYSILKNEDANMVRSCLYYSLFGAHILKEHYKIEPKVHAGIAGYCANAGEKGTLMFAEVSGGNLSCSKNGFHCWVEAEGWLIDFMAPIFPEIMKASGNEQLCKPLMLQKELGLAVSNPGELVNTGDFYVSSNPNLMNELFNNFVSKPANTDLIEICSRWYKKPPKKMLKKIPISDGKGNMGAVSLGGKSVIGVW